MSLIPEKLATIMVADPFSGRKTEPLSQAMQQREAQLAAWRALAGRWQGDDQEVDELVETIYQSRTRSRDLVL